MGEVSGQAWGLSIFVVGQEWRRVPTYGAWLADRSGTEATADRNGDWVWPADSVPTRTVRGQRTGVGPRRG